MCGRCAAARTTAGTGRKERRAGIEPYEPRNNRQEGPEKGLFTGSEGEFVIFRKTDEPKSGNGMDKTSAEPEDSELQKKATDKKRQ
jgi:hypothetical protein